MSLSLAFFSQRSASEIAGRSQLVDNLSALIMGPLGKSFIGLLTATVYCLVMFWFSEPTFIVLGIALVNLPIFPGKSGVRELNQAVTREASLNTGNSCRPFN